MTTADLSEHRPHLLAVAYRLLGSAADADDAVQETWLRWQRAATDDVREPAAWLTTTLTRICLDMLTSARARRESYVGPWLPEPIVTADDPAEEVALADSVRMALLVVLETLSPAERAVFVLHDVFGHTYAEVAEITGRTEAACRQLGHRARSHVEARRPRYGADPSQRALVAERFMHACATGDLDGLMAVLAPDAVVTSDGGGAVRAALRPVRGAGNAARLLIGILRRAPEGAQVAAVQLNGEPGFVGTVDGRPFAAVLLEIAGESVMAVRIVVNPAKLAGVARDGRLRRR